MRLSQDLRRRHGLKGALTTAPRLHLPLNFVGKFQGPPTRAVMEKAAGLAEKAAAPSFQVTLNRVRTWNDPPSLILTADEGMEGVERLHTAIHKALVSGTMAPRREPELQPHILLLRDKTQTPAAPVEPINWTVGEFVMLDSVQDDGRIDVLGRWPLLG